MGWQWRCAPPRSARDWRTSFYVASARWRHGRQPTARSGGASSIGRPGWAARCNRSWAGRGLGMLCWAWACCCRPCRQGWFEPPAPLPPPVRIADSSPISRKERELDPLREMFRYHAWATLTLLDYCAGLPSETLYETAPGTYGTILRT